MTYSLADEEAAKKQAVAEAMRRAIGRASIALEQKGQKPGELRYISLDVRQLYGVANLELGYTTETSDTTTARSGIFSDRKAPSPPLPPPSRPEKITVTANVQCAFQIQ